MSEPVFRPEQLIDHVSWFARAWHRSRKLLGVGWRTLHDSATFTGTVVKGETDPDGDTNFDLFVLPFLTLHCEVDPADLAALRMDLLKLRLGERASVSGQFVVDLPHGHLELHPVTSIITEAMG